MKYAAELSLAVPLYNEEDCVDNDIKELVEYFEKHKVDYELILVNNGSKDDTGKRINKLAMKYKRVKTLHLKKNAGFGGGINAGMRAGRGRYVGFTCSDGQISPQETLKVLQKIKSGNLDIVKTRRITRHDGIERFILSKGYNLLIQVFFLLPIADINGYPVMLKQEIYKALDIKSTNWMINVEILTKARKRKYRIGDVPVTFLAREEGSSHVKLSTPLSFIIQMLRFRFKGPQ